MFERKKMKQGRIVVITGAPGTGKTMAASIIAKGSDMEKSVHMHTDDFYRYLSKGAIPPHLPESNEQNQVVIEAFLEAAKRYVRGGYDVIVDGIIGPWFLKPWLDIVQEGYEVHYIILRANKEETMKRAVNRAKLDRETERPFPCGGGIFDVAGAGEFFFPVSSDECEEQRDYKICLPSIIY